MNKDFYEVYTDGGSRGNPGNSAYAFVVRHLNEEVYSSAGYLGIATNNKAEYQGLLHGLKHVVSEQIQDVKFYSDSELMVKQIKGEYKVKDKDLFELFTQAKNLISKINNFEIIHVRREKNKQADLLVNKTLDEI